MHEKTTNLKCNLYRKTASCRSICQTQFNAPRTQSSSIAIAIITSVVVRCVACAFHFDAHIEGDFHLIENVNGFRVLVQVFTQTVFDVEKRNQFPFKKTQVVFRTWQQSIATQRSRQRKKKWRTEETILTFYSRWATTSARARSNTSLPSNIIVEWYRR